MPFQRLQYQNIALKPITNSFDNNSFIASLFKFEDVKREYTLRDDHAADLKTFVKFMADGNENGTGIYCIIENNYSSPVGFITAEPYRDNMSGDLGWNVGIAVHPAHRNQGHAKNAIQALLDFLSNYTIKTMVLDIGTNNTPARSVAETCGFEQRKSPTGGLVGYYDRAHPEVGMRTQWIKNIHGADPRADAFRKAVDAYRAKIIRSQSGFITKRSKSHIRKAVLLPTLRFIPTSEWHSQVSVSIKKHTNISLRHGTWDVRTRPFPANLNGCGITQVTKSKKYGRAKAFKTHKAFQRRT